MLALETPTALQPVWTVDRHRASIGVDEAAPDVLAVVVTHEPLRLPADELIREADGVFGICVAIRLRGARPAVGIIRATGSGFREYWRAVLPDSRARLEEMQRRVAEGETVHVLWRTDGGFLQAQLGGCNSEHGVWYARMDEVDPEGPRFAVAYCDSPESLLPTVCYEVIDE